MTDSRFSKVFTDPRFMVAPKKVSKVKIDKRFEGMFKKKEFNVVSKVDKYGRKIAKSDNYALQNYYKDDSDAKSDQSGSSNSENPEQVNETKKLGKVESGRSSSEEAGKKFYDDDGKFHWSGQSSSDGEDSDAQKAKKKNKDKSKKKKHDKKVKDS